jgi:hypothetical protein
MVLSGKMNRKDIETGIGQTGAEASNEVEFSVENTRSPSSE